MLEELKKAKAEDIASLFTQIKDVQSQVENYEDSDIPENIKTQKVMHPFYRGIKSDLNNPDVDMEALTSIVESIVKIIRENKIVDFEYNIVVRRNVLIEIEDFLLDDTDLNISPSLAEQIALNAWKIAVENKDSL